MHTFENLLSNHLSKVQFYGISRVGYATSTDGITWTRLASPVLDPGNPGDWDETKVGQVSVLKNGSLYQMWFVGWSGSIGQVGYATSANGVDWTKYAGDPVLTVDAGAWDETEVGGPRVVFDGSTYHLWYHGFTGGCCDSIGYATSPDGINWTKHPSNPVFGPGPSGDWDDGVIYATDVLTDGGQLHMWYTGVRAGGVSCGIGYVTSTDGVTWNRFLAGPVLEEGAPGEWDENYVSWPAVVKTDGLIHMWYRGTGSAGGALGYATSPDGISWTKSPSNPVFRPSQWLWMSVCYGHDWVEGDYEEGHTIWITVTNSSGTVKATAEVETQVIPWWGGRTGFSTNLDDPWEPSQPDIEAGDWVYGLVDDGHASTVRVGTINGDLDVDADTISGTIHANWFTQTLNASCNVWQPGGPGYGFTVDPDGGSYFCDFSSEWDLLPGQDVGVQYQEPDGDWVINVFREPAPDMRVEKWTEGNEVAPGGPVVFTIRYGNDGDAEATTILLTDTLPANTTYVTDTSGFPANVGAGLVTWTLGPLAPDEEERFLLVLANTASPSDTLRNEVDIYTLYDYNDWNDHAETEVHVTDGQPDLYVNKNPAPGDPTPGQTFLYEINYGNNGPVASGSVVLTDTLPDDTSVVSWYSENGYDLWTDVSTSGDQLVLSAPTIPGNWGDRIILRLLVDAGVPVGTQLTNIVEIATANDTNPDDNWGQRDDVWVSDSRWNAGIDKDFGWGQLVPGGEVGYNIHFRNNGNMATQTWVTDTLPAGTSFVEAWIWTGSESVPFLPDYVDDEIVVWDVGLMEPGEWYDLNIRLAIDHTVAPNTVITNCATIAIAGEDEWPFNDTDCVVDTVREPGPNLRVWKRYWWNWEGQLQYEIHFENIGTQNLRDVWITDTYPVSTTVWNWWPDYHRWITATDYAAQGQIVFWVEEIYPGDTGRINLEVDLDGDIIGDQGLAFTNVVEAPISGDVYPDDNYGDVTAYTGPDLYTEKWISDGEPRPGARITFTLRCGNSNVWPWEVSGSTTTRLTERLPDGMTYVTSVWPDGNPNPPWFYDPDTGLIIWDMGGLGSDDYRWFYLVVDLDTDLEGDDVLLNRLEFQEWPVVDIDPNPDNNTFVYPVAVLQPKFEVGKVYESSRMAGTVVTYTLTVTNIGSEAATNVVLSDTIPAYLSGAGTDKTWTLTSIAPNGGTASAGFAAVLPCTAGISIVNDAYRVVSSDQGVTSLPGAPVAFNVIAPTLSPAFDQSATDVGIGETVYFTDTSTTDGTDIVTWAWDFDDGETGSGATVSHAYDSSGAYTVTLTITDACGFGEEISVPNAVNIPPEAPEWEFIFLPLVVRNS